MPSDPLLNGRGREALQTLDGVAYFAVSLVRDSKVVTRWSLPFFVFGSLICERNPLVGALAVLQIGDLRAVKGFVILVHSGTQRGFVLGDSFYSRVVLFLFLALGPKDGVLDSGRGKLVGYLISIMTRSFCFLRLPSCMLDETAELFIFGLVWFFGFSL